MSVNSMTGFARATGCEDECSWTWELKSVNGKGLDIRCRVPAGFERLEPLVRKRLKDTLGRGHVSVALLVEQEHGEADIRVNHQALNQIISLLPEIQKNLPDAPPPSIEGLLALRGVMESVEIDLPVETEALDDALLSGFDVALASLAAMRAEEGAAMASILTTQLDKMTDLIDAIDNVAAQLPKNVKARLQAQVAELLEAVPALPEEKLAQEAALILIKSDIREELDRLKAHVIATKTHLNQGGPMGRKLDFLCQEFSREANTVCSKSPDIEITRLGLDIKSIIDQLREQVQNIE